MSYHQFTPTKNFISYDYSLKLIRTSMYRPHAVVSTELQGNATWIFKNFWDVNLNTGAQPFWQNDYFELQTANKFVKKPPYWYALVNGSTDSRKKLFFSYQLGVADGGVFEDNMFLQLGGGLRYRFSNKFSLSLDVDRRHDNLQIGYAFVQVNDAPVLGFRDYKDVTTILSGSYNFTPRMNVTLRARHYWNAVHYRSFYDVRDDGFYDTDCLHPGTGPEL